MAFQRNIAFRTLVRGPPAVCYCGLTTGDRYTTDSGGKSFHLHWYVVPLAGWICEYASLNIPFREPVLVSSPLILEEFYY